MQNLKMIAFVITAALLAGQCYAADVEKIEVANNTTYKVQMLIFEHSSKAFYIEVKPDDIKPRTLDVDEYLIGKGWTCVISLFDGQNDRFISKFKVGAWYGETQELGSINVKFDYVPAQKTAKIMIADPAKKKS